LRVSLYNKIINLIHKLGYLVTGLVVVNS
jgi:hypothetical protein